MQPSNSRMNLPAVIINSNSNLPRKPEGSTILDERRPHTMIQEGLQARHLLQQTVCNMLVALRITMIR